MTKKKNLFSRDHLSRVFVEFNFFFIFCQGGIYVLNIFDSQSGGFSLICVVVLEAVAVSWGYGEYSQ